MIVKNYFADGYVEENSFVIIDENTGKTAIIDPSFESGFDFSAYDNIDFILLTHGHFDHIADTIKIKEKYGSKIVCHKDEKDLIENPKLNLSIMFGQRLSFCADILLEDGDTFMLGDTKISLIHTAGHTKGSCCYIADGHIFSGDTFMKGTIGRTDLPTGDYSQIMKSVEKLKKLDKDYIAHCGHGDNTSLENEKRNNEFFNQRTIFEF
ncbi:MAG: MBL fold metallo-hydrolase [Clostridia bacterium]